MKLSPHFALVELLASETAVRKRIDNTPTPEVQNNLAFLAGCLEVVRELLGNKPILISSGYRSSQLNAAVGGSRTSAHISGLAADFICPGFGTPLEICQVLARRAGQISFDQLIQEGTWVHIGFAASGKVPRHQVLTASFGASGTNYVSGLGD